METDNGKRLDPRFIEEGSNPEAWIRVRVAEQFNQMRVFDGFLRDLTPRAVKVAFPRETGTVEFPVGTATLLSFRMPNEKMVAATAVVSRIDKAEHNFGMVLFFEFIRGHDRDAIREVCETYVRDRVRREGACTD